MITLITYDITEPKRLNDMRKFLKEFGLRTPLHIHKNTTCNDMRKFLKEFGLRTQKSVFECDIDDVALGRIRAYCRDNLDIAKDSVRIYKICNRCINKVVISGTGLKVTQLDYLIV